MKDVPGILMQIQVLFCLGLKDITYVVKVDINIRNVYQFLQRFLVVQKFLFAE